MPFGPSNRNRLVHGSDADVLTQIEQRHQREREALIRLLSAQALEPPRRRSLFQRLWRRMSG